METELIKIEEKSVIDAFQSENGLQPFVDQAKAIVNDFEHDLSTEAGRKKTASLAAKIAKVKTRVDSIGKDLVSGWKEKAKAVDASRKSMRDQMDELKVQARQPLTEWENAENARIEKHTSALSRITELSSLTRPDTGEPLSIDDLKANRLMIEDFREDDFEEFQDQANGLISSGIDNIEAAISREQKRLEDEAELARLRAAEESRLQKEREEQEKREAEEREKLRREQIQKELEAKHQRELEEEKRKVEQAERDRIAAEERAKLEAEQAQKREAEAAEAARQAEINRQREEQERERIETEKREANKRHVGAIRKAAKESLMAFVDEETAKKIVIAINDGEIKNVTINY